MEPTTARVACGFDKVVFCNSRRIDDRARVKLVELGVGVMFGEVRFKYNSADAIGTRLLSGRLHFHGPISDFIQSTDDELLSSSSCVGRMSYTLHFLLVF